MDDSEFKPLMDWLLKDLPPPQPQQGLPSRGTILRWEEEKKEKKEDRDSWSMLSELKHTLRYREQWLLELETDAANMEADGNDGWPPNFIAPMGLKTAVVKGILSADGWSPLKEKLRLIRELKEEIQEIKRVLQLS